MVGVHTEQTIGDRMGTLALNYAVVLCGQCLSSGLPNRSECSAVGVCVFAVTTVSSVKSPACLPSCVTADLLVLLDDSVVSATAGVSFITLTRFSCEWSCDVHAVIINNFECEIVGRSSACVFVARCTVRFPLSLHFTFACDGNLRVCLTCCNHSSSWKQERVANYCGPAPQLFSHKERTPTQTKQCTCCAAGSSLHARSRSDPFVCL